MRVYFLTKSSIIRSIFVFIVIISSIMLTNTYKDEVIGVFKPNRDIPIYSVETDQKKVAITFDNAWGGDDIPQIINILGKYNVKATFFPVGNWMDRYPDKIKALSAAGHEISNHSDSHPDMTSLSKDKMRTEIENANKKIRDLIGKDNKLFRSPYGSYNEDVVKTVKDMGMYIIQWDVDSLDWKNLGVEPMVRRVVDKTQNGSIILFHNDTKYTAQALPTIIESLKAKGFEFVTVSDLIYKDNFYIDSQGVQRPLVKEKASLD